MINTRKLREFCTTFPKNFMFSDKIPIFSLMAAHANAIALAGRQSKILPHGIFLS